METRIADVDGLRLPTWQQVLDRDYRPWDASHLVIDACASDVPQSVAAIRRAAAAENA